MRSQPSGISPSSDSEPSSSPSPKTPKRGMTNESLEKVTKTHSVFTLYLGGRILSFYTVLVVLASVALLVLTIISYTSIPTQATDSLNVYLGSSSSQIYNSSVWSFLSSIMAAQTMINSSMSLSAVHKFQPALYSLWTVPDSTSAVYSHSTWFSNGSMQATSNAVDCSTSQTYSCDTTYSSSDIRSSGWYSSVSALHSSTGSLWNGPYAEVSSDNSSAVSLIDLMWKSPNSDGSTFSAFRMRIDTSFLPLPSDQYLDSTGAGSVFVLNRYTGNVVSAAGLNQSTYLSFNTSTTSAVLYSVYTEDGIAAIGSDWLAGLSQAVIINATEISVSEMSGFKKSLAVIPISTTNFTILIASSNEAFVDSTQSTLILAEMIVSILPIALAIISALAFSLRVVAVRRRKAVRAAELKEAHKAAEDMKNLKMKQFQAASVSTTGTNRAIALASQRSYSPRRR